MNFTDHERRIFPFHDGTAPVLGDPLRIARRLTQALGGDPNKWLRRYYADRYDDAGNPFPEPVPERLPLVLEAQEKLIEAARHAFELAAFDRATGKGADERHCLKVLLDFLAWEDGKKKAGPSSPTSSAFSDFRPAPSTSPPTTPSSSTKADCGCAPPG